ncbi:MAG: hypothetical protein ACRDVP_06460 [Acidimicrobiales bacterium]
MSSSPRKWLDHSQPQALQAAVLLSYLNAALAILYVLVFHAVVPLVLLAAALGAYGIANERRLGYIVAVLASCIYVAFQIIAFVVFPGSLASILNLAFAILLVVLLLHADSRRYAKIWFR